MISKIKKIEEKILSVKNALSKARDDEYDPYGDNEEDEYDGLSIRSDDEMSDDAADKWLQENDSDAPKAPSTPSSPKKLEAATDEELANMKDIARHWMSSADQLKRQEASAKKNPVVVRVGLPIQFHL